MNFPLRVLWSSLNGMILFYVAFYIKWSLCVYIYSLWLAYVLHLISLFSKGFLDDAVVKNSSANSGGSGEVGSIPGPGSSPREGNGSLLQYFCLENPMDKATWQAAAHWVTKSGHIWVAEHERTHTHTHTKLFSKLPNVSYFVKYLCPVRVLIPESNRKDYQNIHISSKYAK